MDAASLVAMIEEQQRESWRVVEAAGRALAAAVDGFNWEVELLGAPQEWRVQPESSARDFGVGRVPLESAALSMTEQEVAALEPGAAVTLLPALCESLRGGSGEAGAAAAALQRVVRWHGARLLAVKELQLTWRHVRATAKTLLEGECAAEQREQLCYVLRVVNSHLQ